MSGEPKRPIEERLEAWAERRRATTGGPFMIHPATRKMLLDEAHRQHPKAAMSQLKTEPNDAAPTPFSKWLRRLAVGATAAFVTVILATVYLPGPRKDMWQLTKADDVPPVRADQAQPQAAAQNLSKHPPGSAAGRARDTNPNPPSALVKSPLPGGRGERQGIEPAGQSAMQLGNALSPLEVQSIDVAPQKQAREAGASEPVSGTRAARGERPNANADTASTITLGGSAGTNMTIAKSGESSSPDKSVPKASPGSKSGVRLRDTAAAALPRSEPAVAPTPDSVSFRKPLEAKKDAVGSANQPGTGATKKSGDEFLLTRKVESAPPTEAETMAGAKSKTSQSGDEKVDAVKGSSDAPSLMTAPAAPMVFTITPAPLIAPGESKQAAHAAAPELLTLEKLQLRQQFSQVDNRAKLRRNFNSPVTPSVLDTFHFENQGHAVRIVDADGSVYTGLLGETVADRFSMSRPANPAAIPFRASGSNRTLDQQIIFDGDLAVPAADAGNGQIRGRVTIGGHVQLEVNATASPR